MSWLTPSPEPCACPPESQHGQPTHRDGGSQPRGCDLTSKRPEGEHSGRRSLSYGKWRARSTHPKRAGAFRTSHGQTAARSAGCCLWGTFGRCLSDSLLIAAVLDPTWLQGWQQLAGRPIVGPTPCELFHVTFNTALIIAQHSGSPVSPSPCREGGSPRSRRQQVGERPKLACLFAALISADWEPSFRTDVHHDRIAP